MSGTHCYRCGEPNAETLQAMAEVEAGDLVTADTVAELFADLREEDGTPRLSCGVDS